MSMTMESGPSTSEKSPVIESVPSQVELKELYGTKSDNSIGARIEPDSLAALNAMFDTEPSGDKVDASEAPALEAEPMTNEPEPARSRFARFLDKVSQGVATAADRQQEKFEATQLLKAQRADQDAAYDSYAENIEVTEQREAQERAEARQEKIDAAKVAMRRFGRSALTLPRRARIEAKAQFTVAKEVVAEKRDAVINAYNETDKKIADRLDSVANAITGTAENTIDSIKTFFAEKKAAAEARKVARQEARLQREAQRARDRAVNKEVNERVEANRVVELRAARAARLAQKATSATLNTERAA